MPGRTLPRSPLPISLRGISMESALDPFMSDIVKFVKESSGVQRRLLSIRMHVSPELVLLMLLFRKACSIVSCPHPCTCDLLGAQSLKVNCSFKDLEEVPPLPSETEELYLQDNLLMSIHPGQFDGLSALMSINLSSNPWNCDCNIMYLKAWLEDQPLKMHGEVVCSTPAFLFRKPVAHLTGNELTSCSNRRTSCSDFVFKDAFLFALVFLLFALLIVCILITRKLHFKLEVNEDVMELDQIVKPAFSEARKRRTFNFMERY